MIEVQIDVVIPTYRRHDLLERCLRALAAQQHQPTSVIVVVRADDEDSKNTLTRVSAEVLVPVVMVEITEPGVIAAMSAGVARTSTPFVAFTDDDARPRADWLSGIADHFHDPAVGGVGGRDVIAGQEHPLTEDVGRFGGSGKLVGNHHLGTGGPRSVDVLKGVNMAFRAVALALPAPGVLRGDGAQVDFEVLICTWALQRGWRLIYDPNVVVDHEPAPRRDADQRGHPQPRAVFDAAYNSVVAAAVLDRPYRVRRAILPVFVGTGDRPGFARGVVAAARGERQVLRRVLPALRGRIVAASRLFLRRRPLACTVVISAEVLRGGHSSRSIPVVALVAHDIDDDCGGMERACAELIRRGSGKVGFIVVSASLAPKLRPLVLRWVHVRVPARPFPLKFALFWRLAGRVLRRIDADIVHTIGAIVPNRVDVASIHFCHAGFLAANSLAPRATPRLRRANTALSRVLALAAERWSYRPSRLRAFAAVSQGVVGEVTRHYPAIPVTVTPNGVDVERFRPDPEARAALRSAEAVGDGVVALFVGGDWDRKGLGIAIEAVDKARASGHDVHLWVVGQGDATRFAALAEQSGVAQAVRFFGPRPDTQRFYQAADIFVLPSAYETFSLVCFEAAACGLPLIVPPVSGAVEIVGSTEGGLLVTRSGHSVAHALATLAADPALRDRLGAEARRRASTYTWQRSAGSVMALYETVLAEREVKR